MSVPSLLPTRPSTVAELRRLPADERDAILAAAAAIAAEEYEDAGQQKPLELAKGTPTR
jgi:hypothetical protein